MIPKRAGETPLQLFFCITLPGEGERTIDKSGKYEPITIISNKDEYDSYIMKIWLKTVPLSEIPRWLELELFFPV